MRGKQLWELTKSEWDAHISAYSLLLRDLRRLRSNCNIQVWNEISNSAASAEESLAALIRQLKIHSRSAIE